MPGKGTASVKESDFAVGLGHRIDLVAEQMGGKRALARAANLIESQIHKYVAAKNMPGLNVVVSIADAAGVSLEWLATGRGEKRGAERALAVDELADYVLLPFYGDDAGGVKSIERLALNKTWILKYLHSRTNDLHLYSIDSDNMAPTLDTGDIIVFDSGRCSADKDGIYLMQIRESLVVRRAQIVLQGLRISCDNKLFQESFVLTNDELSDVSKVKIVGRMVSVFKKVRSELQFDHSPLAPKQSSYKMEL